MSQCYRVQLKASVSRVVRAADEVSYPIDLTEILPGEDMRALLRESLIERGFRPEGESHLVKKGSHGETLTVDLETMAATASLSSEKEVTTEVSAVGAGGGKDGAQKSAERALEERKREAERALDNTSGDLQRDVTARLAAGEEERLGELNAALQRVYAEALKRKAHELGEVMEVREGTNADGQYELTIRVEQ